MKIVDPHTAVGLVAAGKEMGGNSNGRAAPIIHLATAHPAKFPEAVKAAIGREPAEPEQVTRQKNMKERLTVVANNASEVARLIERQVHNLRTPV